MILSIDIGIRNLSLCCIDYVTQSDFSSYQIKLWDVYNTLEMEQHICESLKKDNQQCGKLCNYKYSSDNQTIYTCKTHFPKNVEIKKQNHYKQKLVNDYLLQDIARIVLTKLQSIYDDNIEIFAKIRGIVIELQPKVNQKMKFISHIIYGKLVELYYNTSTTIRFVRAAQKLKAYNGPILQCNLKSSYAKRKWLSIQYTNWFLENRFCENEKLKWHEHFNNHKKRDDMGDTLLMSINAIYGVPKSSDKNGRCIK